MKLLFTIGLFIISSYTCLAQGFGLQAGIKLNNSDVKCAGIEADTKAGIEIGAFYEIALPVITTWKVNAGLLYSNHRFSLQDDYGNNTGITYHFSENNIKLPVKIRWQPDLGLIKPFINGGVYSSYMFSGKIKDSDSRESLKYKDSKDKIDYGISIGVGVYLMSHIGLNINYDMGFAERNIMLGEQFVSAKNKECSILLNYRF